MNTTSIWNRTGTGTMSANLYAFMVAFWTAFGIATSAVAASISQSWVDSLWLLILPLLISLAGIHIAKSSDNPALSLLGYLLITVPFGLMLGPVVALYTPASITRILSITTWMVLGLGLLGAIIPKSLESWASWLFAGLLALLGGYILLPIASWLGIPIGSALTLWDWAGVALFSVYVVYDMNRAMRIPYTLDNAIDSAIEIYLDYANLFIRLLSLLGESNDK